MTLLPRLAVALVIATSTLACGGGEGVSDEAGEGAAITGAAPEAEKITITDSTGAEVSIPGPAKRIASLAPAFTEILYAIGCEDRIAITDNWSDHPAEAAKLDAAIARNLQELGFLEVEE